MLDNRRNPKKAMINTALNTGAKKKLEVGSIILASVGMYIIFHCTMVSGRLICTAFKIFYIWVIPHPKINVSDNEVCSTS